MSQRKLFRFANIGPLEKSLDSDLNFIPIRFEFQSSPLLKAVLGAKGIEARMDLLKDFMEKKYIKGWAAAGEDKEKFLDILLAIRKIAKNNLLPSSAEQKLIQKVHGLILSRYTQVWESLYASLILRGPYVENIAEQVELIKFVKVIEYLNTNKLTLEMFESTFKKHQVVITTPDQLRTKIRRMNSKKWFTFRQHFQEYLKLIEQYSQEKSEEKKAILTTKVRNHYANGIGKIKYIQRTSQDKMTVSDYVKAASLVRKTKSVDHMDPRTADKLLFEMMNESYDMNFDKDVDLPPENDISELYKVKKLGEGILYVVEEDFQYYELAKISQIENIMKSEIKKRVFVSLSEIEQTFESNVHEIQDTTHDNQVDENYRLSSEISKTINTNMTIAAGTNMSAKFGPVNLSANANFNMSHSSSLNQTSASEFSKDVMNRTVERMMTETSQLSSTRMLNRIKDRSEHGFDNTKGSDHVRGVYRWLDQVSRIKLYDYGYRTFYQFTLPEPASRYQQLLQEQYAVQESEMFNPEYPTISPTDISIEDDEYLEICKLYRVEEIPSPPAKFVSISGSYSSPATGEGDGGKSVNRDKFRVLTSADLLVPEGYRADEADIDAIALGAAGANNDERHLMITVGSYRYSKPIAEKDFINFEQHADSLTTSSTDPNKEYKGGTIPVSILANAVEAFAINVKVLCVRTEEAVEKWQNEVYKAILQSYNKFKSEFEMKKAQKEYALQDYKSRNLTDDEKQKIIIAELKRNAVDVLTRGDYLDLESMTRTAEAQPLEILYNKSIRDGAKILYFENCFEWEQMTYVFHPYFWADQTRWKEKLMATDSNSQFSHFLSAGSVQVIVPVRQGYELSVNTFIETGATVESMELPIFDNEVDFYMANILHRDEDKRLVDEWDERYPTNLVIVQDYEEAQAIIREPAVAVP